MLFNTQPVDWPLNSNIIRRGSESHTFGMVRRDAKKQPKAHQGWDLYATPGTACYAIGDGAVEYVGDRGDLGNVIILYLPVAKVYAVYAHLSKISVLKGQHVKLGDRIGSTGTTGNAAKLVGEDQHLHFEIRTSPFPGLGLNWRISPLGVFGVCPLRSAEERQAIK